MFNSDEYSMWGFYPFIPNVGPFLDTLILDNCYQIQVQGYSNNLKHKSQIFIHITNNLQWIHACQADVEEEGGCPDFRTNIPQGK